MRAHLTFRTDARFVLAIETGGRHLNNHRFWETPRCIIVEMGGCRPAPRGASSACFPTSRTLPVYCFVDCDPYGFTNIYRTLKVGSGNAAHINRFLCVPRARFLGVGEVRRRRDDLQRGIGRLSLEFPHVPNVRELANCPVNSVVRNPH